MYLRSYLPSIFSHSDSLSLSHTHTFSLYLPQTRTPTHTNSLSLSLTHTHTHTHILFLSLSHSLTHSLSLTFSPTFFFSLSHRCFSHTPLTLMESLYPRTFLTRNTLRYPSGSWIRQFQNYSPSLHSIILKICPH